MSVDLQYEGTLTVSLKSPVMVGAGPFGTRMFIEVADGELEGPRVTGKVLPGGGDWVLLSADGWCRMDVRAQFETSDGCAIYAQFPGLIEMTEAVEQAFMEGAATNFTDQYFRITPRLEAGDDEYAWVNQALFAAEGRFVEGFGLQYRMYRLT